MNILVVDDNISLLKAMKIFLKEEDCNPFTATTVAEALSLIAKYKFDLVITDLRLPDGEGLQVIEFALKVKPKPEIILMTAFGTVETAVEAMRLGAMDYLTKPVSMEEFSFRLNKVKEIRNLEKENESLIKSKRRLLESSGFLSPIDKILGESKQIMQIKNLIRKVANYPSTVLITGETGVGKEMVARSIHSLSKQADGPFVRVNCASIPFSLFESELFGHEKGAFTDAKNQRAGYFEEAENGTLFLDEVGEIPFELQAKLLRALQEKEITRVGSSVSIKTNARIVAATNKNLESMIADNLFRQDLLYRLSVVKIEIPPLRERKSDIPLLCNSMIKNLAKELGKKNIEISDEALNYLASQKWQGNIRQLKNSLERAIVLSDSNILDIESFNSDSPASERNGSVKNHFTSKEGLIKTLEILEKEMIMNALKANNGVKSHAADALKIPRTQLLYRMKRLGLD